MSRIVFLLEEYSMAVLLEGLLPRAFPGLDFLCVWHEGKNDLEKPRSRAEHVAELASLPRRDQAVG